MLDAGWTSRTLTLAALCLGAVAAAGCTVVFDEYEIDLTVEIDDPQMAGVTAGYAAFVYVLRGFNCAGVDYNWGESNATILGWDSIEIPGEVTVDGYYDAGGDDCFRGIYVGAYRDGDHQGSIDYYPGDRCADRPLSDPTVREAPITLTLDDQNCFDNYYWGETDEEKP
jgi:hypothetical protein